MYTFESAKQSWWQKPLVKHDDKFLPAELVVLQVEKRDTEDGVWINSRGTKTGAYDLVMEQGKFRTLRRNIPTL